MVNQTYLLHKPPPPSPAKVFLDLRVIPFLINAVGAMEMQLERLAMAARARPVPMAAASFASGWMVAALMHARRR